MKNKLLVALLVLLALLTVSAQTKPAAWEYKHTVNFRDVQKLGLEGWELVAIDGGSAASTYYLKRQK
jgi:hypothetical protein